MSLAAGAVAAARSRDSAAALREIPMSKLKAQDDFSTYVPHPRFGQGPRLTEDSVNEGALAHEDIARCSPKDERLLAIRSRIDALVERGSPGEIVVSPMGEGDRARVVELAPRLGGHLNTDALGPDATDDEIWAQWSSDRPGHAFTAVREDQLIGATVLRPSLPGHGSHIARLSYAVDGWPRTHGVGRKLIEASIEAAESLGYRALLVHWLDGNYQLPLSLWDSLGFEIAGTIPKGYQPSAGDFLDYQILHRRLDTQRA